MSTPPPIAETETLNEDGSVTCTCSLTYGGVTRTASFHVSAAELHTDHEALMAIVTSRRAHAHNQCVAGVFLDAEGVKRMQDDIATSTTAETTRTVRDAEEDHERAEYDNAVVLAGLNRAKAHGGHQGDLAQALPAVRFQGDKPSE